jgi:transposase
LAVEAKGRVLMQDGARSHVARDTLGYLASKSVKVLPNWPPYAPDWNPIEKLWNELKSRVGLRCPMDIDELKVVATEEWNGMSQALIDAHCKHFETLIGHSRK